MPPRSPAAVAYYVVAAGVWLLFAGHAIDQDWSRDVWIHAAAVDSFADDLLDPANPTIGTGDRGTICASPSAASSSLQVHRTMSHPAPASA